VSAGLHDIQGEPNRASHPLSLGPSHLGMALNKNHYELGLKRTVGCKYVGMIRIHGWCGQLDDRSQKARQEARTPHQPLASVLKEVRQE
jgi:hypothetical protein